MGDLNVSLIEDLIDRGKKARDHSYSPYSKFSVGAALMTDSGAIYSGSNIENRSYGLTICAERNAVSTAIADGEKKIDVIVVVADTKKPVMPCGACREVISEFANNNTKIICANLQGDQLQFGVEDLLPHAFDFDVEP